MEPVEVFRKTETDTDWEFAVEVGYDSSLEGELGFLVRIGKIYWSNITHALYPPEEVIEHAFHFLLSKYHKSTLPREFQLEDLEKEYPELQEFLSHRFQKE